MRHLKNTFKFNRTAAHRKAMLRNLLTSLLRYERIKTTLAKAKLIKKNIDKYIVLGKKGDLHSKRQVMRDIKARDVLRKLFYILPQRYKDLNSGFVKLYRLGFRHGDGARMALIELVNAEVKKYEKPKKVKNEEQQKQQPPIINPLPKTGL